MADELQKEALRFFAVGPPLKTGVYLITNKTDGKIYVGSAAWSFNRRWNVHRHHLRFGRHDNPHLQRAWNRDGERSFEFSILARCDLEWCLALETMHIARLGADGMARGYNLHAPGLGMLGRKHTEETRKKLRESHLGYVMPDSQKMKISAANIGRKLSRATMAKRKATWDSLEYREQQRKNALFQWSKKKAITE